MAGNSSRKGAIRKSGSKKGSTVGSGGQGRKALEPKGPTPKAADRPGHPAARRKRAADRAAPPAKRGGPGSSADVVAGRNPVLEALSAGMPATALYLQDSAEADERIRSAVGIARKRGLELIVGTKAEVDSIAHTSAHQGIALVTAGFPYRTAEELPAGRDGTVLVALDHVTDPHNLGAIARSAQAFDAGALIVPQRRSAPVTAAAWKASAGALASLPVARVGNLNSTLEQLQQRGYFVLGLAGDADTDITGISPALAGGPLVLVIGSEGAGLSARTAQICDLLIRIPMPGRMESLNASVAAGIALYAIRQAQT